MSFLVEYGLFTAKLFTLLVAVLVLIAFILAITIKDKEYKHKLRVKRLNKKYRRYKHIMNEAILRRHEFKDYKKILKKEKLRFKRDPERRRIFVMDFDGDIQASDTESLAESITAILTTATPHDEVVLRLESAGGIVHAYGLAASQLKRLRDKNIPLVVTVDKMAASGGYMMACIANRIISAPFAVVGSVGVIAQLPNFNKLLKAHDIEFEQIMAGEYKRTLSMFGVNTKKDREKMQEDVENIHTLFKQFVIENRPQVNIESVATGEHWHGVQALQLNLVDQLMTSDDYLLTASEHADIYEVSITGRKPFMQKLTHSLSSVLQNFTTQYLFYKNKTL